MGGRIMNFSLTALPCYPLKSLAWKGLGMGGARLRDGSPLRDQLVNVLGQSGNQTGGAVLAAYSRASSELD